ncbi:hypothetical protein [Nocardia sp. SYP-A9097]|uniref:hypothetical protein n=1 Tax=Nocardia sp. SYP-A9097 TaxID=2663237 RepID=UPI0018914526|nr:hypothetical protein [Nocardia sp. SYP-A9097]
MGIRVHEGAAITGVEANGAVTETGRIPAEITMWTAGFTVHPIAAATTLAVSDTGQIVVDGTMRSISHPTLMIPSRRRRIAPASRVESTAITQ